MLDKFMSEHLFGKSIEVYFGGDEKERMRGKLVGSADGVIVLENNDYFTETGSRLALADFIGSISGAFWNSSPYKPYPTL